MNQIFTKIEKYFKEQPYVGLMIVILTASIGFNIYLLEQPGWLTKDKVDESRANNVQFVQNVRTIDEGEAPWGVKSEVYARYEDKKWKTYSTSTPITEEEALEMRRDIIEQHKAIREYFRKQDELMRDFWQSFWW